MRTIELYTHDLSPFAQMVELHLAIKEIDYSRIVPLRETVREGDYVDINPLRKLPSLVINGTAVPESTVVVELIEELYPIPPLMPHDPFERAHVRLLLRTADVYFAMPSVQLAQVSLDGVNDELIGRAIDLVERGIRGLEQWLGPQAFAAGDALSIADCALPPALFAISEMVPGLTGRRLPEFGMKGQRYFDTIQRHEPVRRCLERMRSSLRARIGGNLRHVPQ